MRYDCWDISGFDREKAAALCQDSGSPVNPLVSVLLTSRGITAPEDVKAFLDVDALPFHDPFLMADMDKAVARIRKAVENKELIAIYGDYDVDGMTSAALLALWLDSKGAQYEIYIPGRFDEGYGVNTGALDTLKDRGAQLVVTVDCGITAVKETQHAKDIGLDIVITDHHECKDALPDATAVVDPKRPDCAYPYKQLAGVGVVFKLLCALEEGCNDEEVFDRYGQYVALGTVADVMPVTGENRKLIVYGLRLLNSNPSPGLRCLIDEVCQESAKVTSTTIGFVLAPRFNAAGRMSDPLLSVKLLLSRDNAEAGQYVAELCRLNAERRKLEQEILEEALKRLGDDEPTQPIVLAGEDWYQGVTGIVAAKMADRFRLPAIIISIGEDGLGRGSCRSFGSFPIYDALRSCEDLLTTFGGHEMAAGITLPVDNIDKLRGRITEFYREHAKDTPAAGLRVDFEVDKPMRLLTLENIEALQSMEPYGSGNPAPCLCIMGAKLTSLSSIGMGKHAKLRIEKAGHELECIFFSAQADALGVAVGDFVDIAFEPQINDFRDRKSVQLQLSDIRKTL